MSEEALLNDIFGIPRYKGKYVVSWCDHCNQAIITCGKCHNTTCNGGGCKECVDDFDEFSCLNTRAENYLHPTEWDVIKKYRALKKFMIPSLGLGEKGINWSRLDVDGKLSENDIEMFSRFFKD